MPRVHALRSAPTPGVFDQHLAGWCQADLARAALQQPNPQLSLQDMDPMRDRRLGHSDARGRTTVVAVLGARHKSTQVAPVHGSKINLPSALKPNQLFQ